MACDIAKHVHKPKKTNETISDKVYNLSNRHNSGCTTDISNFDDSMARSFDTS